jgi:CubicO group peptidase (beta-lactamase class C family)
MSRRYVALALVFTGVMGSASGAQASESTPVSAASQVAPISDLAKKGITAQLDAAVARGDTPGVVALVVDRNGEIYSAARGKLDTDGNVPMPSDAIFAIASMTKPVTSVAIMMLAERGKLKIDDPVSKYLPGFDHLQVITKFNESDGSYETQPAQHAITIRHLLTHTSGIGYAFCNPIVAKLQKSPDIEEWKLPLVSEPGTKWNYSASTRVLGLVVEKVSGTSLEDFFQDNILEPLGMRDTSFAVPTEKQARLSRVNIRGSDGAFQQRPPANTASAPTPPYRGDGGLYSTAHDYGLFIRMLLNGGKLGSARILSESSVRAMGENNIGAIFVEQQPAALPQVTKPFPLGAGRDKFGLGFQLTAASDDTRTYRSAGSMSWAGIYNTEFWIDPRMHVGGVLLMQTLPFYDDGAIRTLQSFEKSVYRALR